MPKIGQGAATLVVACVLASCSSSSDDVQEFVVVDVGSNYVLKGPLDVRSMDVDSSCFIGQRMVVADSYIVAPSCRFDENYRVCFDEYDRNREDTLRFGRRYWLKVREVELSHLYPGDELVHLGFRELPDSLRYISGSFLSMLEVGNDSVQVIQLLDSSGDFSTCSLFLSHDGIPAVLFSYGHQLLLFLHDVDSGNSASRESL